jgi:hypothetical protein
VYVAKSMLLISASILSAAVPSVVAPPFFALASNGVVVFISRLMPSVHPLAADQFAKRDLIPIGAANTFRSFLPATTYKSYLDGILANIQGGACANVSANITDLVSLGAQWASKEIYPSGLSACNPTALAGFTGFEIGGLPASVVCICEPFPALLLSVCGDSPVLCPRIALAIPSFLTVRLRPVSCGQGQALFANNTPFRWSPPPVCKLGLLLSPVIPLPLPASTRRRLARSTP